MASGSVYCGWAVGVVGFTVLGFREQLRLAVANSGPELFPVDGAIRRHGQLAGLAGNAGAGNLLQQGKAFAQLPGVRAQGKQAAELALGSAEVLVGFISEWILFRQYPGDVSEHHVVDVAVFAWIRFAAINNGRGVNWQIAAVIEGKQWLELPCDGGGGYQHNALGILSAPGFELYVQADGALHGNGAVAGGGNAQQVCGHLAQVVFGEEALDGEGSEVERFRPGSEGGFYPVAPFTARNQYQYLMDAVCCELVGNLSCFIFCRQAELIKAVRQSAFGGQVIESEYRGGQRVQGGQLCQTVFLKGADNKVGFGFSQLLIELPE